MPAAKCLRRQAATCAAMARQTNDEDSRQRYIRLEQLYLQLADDEEAAAEQTNTFPIETLPDPIAHRPN